MADWSTPRIWVAGEVVTASLMNTYVRDQFLALFPTALNAVVEDIPYNSVNFQGTGGMVWTVASGDVAWQWIYRVGRRALVSVGASTTSISGTPTGAVLVGFQNLSFLNLSAMTKSAPYDNGTPVSALCQVDSGSNQVRVTLWSGNWSVSTNNTLVQFTLDTH